MTFQGSSHPPAPRSGAFPSAVSHYPNYHSGFLSPLERRSAGTVLLQSSRPGIISVLGTQHYRQHWRRVSTLRAGKTNRVCSDLMFTSAQRGCLVFLGFVFACFVCKPTACSLVWMPMWIGSRKVCKSQGLFSDPHVHKT